jgi:PEP-CTERM motif
LSGPDWDSCTQGTTVGNTCQGGPGGVAANFAPNTITYSWSGGSIAAGADFDITFASWQQGNSAYVTPGSSPVPEPSSLILIATGLFSAAGLVRRRLNN